MDDTTTHSVFAERPASADVRRLFAPRAVVGRSIILLELEELGFHASLGARLGLLVHADHFLVVTATTTTDVTSSPTLRRFRTRCLNIHIVSCIMSDN